MRNLAPLLVVFIAACEQPRPKWTESPCRMELFEQSRFTVCEGRNHALHLIAADDDEVPKRSFAEVGSEIAAARVAFAMNAGMFDAEGRPIGLAIVDGRVVHPINLRDGGGNFHLKPNGVFFIRRDGSAAVVSSASFQPSADIAFATQSGPMLVIDGAIHPSFDADGQSQFIRNGVGIGDSGQPLFVISNEVVSFGKMARFFRDGLGADNALYFDGSVSSLWDPANGRMDAGVPLGPMIVALKPARPAEESAPGRADRATP